MLDGAEYFAELGAVLDGLGTGDAVLIASLSVDPELELNGRLPGDAGYDPLGERLARAAAADATVRVLLAGRVLASSLPVLGLEDFRKNVLRAQALREWRPAGSPGASPLAGCALVDFSGSLPGSNHQKVAVVSRGGVLTAFVGGIDLKFDRLDGTPHDTMRLDGERWGWHDAVVRLRGRAAERVWAVLAQRWHEAATLPPKHYVRRPPRWEPINPVAPRSAPPAAPEQTRIGRPGTSVRVLRSVPRLKFTSVFPGRSVPWESLPPRGIQEIYRTLSTAIAAARRYVYIEDQYLSEELGGDHSFELYPYLRDAARRRVKVILVGSGIRDPEDPGVHVRPINRSLNRDLRRKIVDQLDAEQRTNVAVYRIEHCTVHAKLTLIDDVFANIGSANLFSRSMGGVDTELSSAVTTTTSLVRDLRVRVWGEHLRAAVTSELRPALEDLDRALGIWDTRWLPATAPISTWRAAGEPAGFAPVEKVLFRVDA